MKRMRELPQWFFVPCLIAALLCGLLTVSASAAGLNPDEVQITLTWSGVDSSVTTAVHDGDTVTDGNLTFYEDGIQVEINGEFLIPIDASGTTTISYNFDPAKTYTVSVEEKLAEPYYEAKEFTIDATAAHTTGLAVNKTVKWVQWSKPIKVSLVDSNGVPLAIQGVDVSLADTDILSMQFQSPEPRKTNISGTATFPSHSYDPNDPDMTNILNAQVLLSAQYTPISGGNPTTVAKIVRLDLNPNTKKNEVDLLWPTATVSGMVRNADGSPAANTRVAAYYGLPALGQDFIEYPFTSDKTLHLSFTMEPSVYYTTTDANGNYTLGLPEGWAEICAGDSQGSVVNGPLFSHKKYYGSAAYDYYAAVLPHFPWISVIDDEALKPFQGIFCREVFPLCLNAISDGIYPDLILNGGADGYHLKANITLNGQPWTSDLGTLSLAFNTQGVFGSSDIHTGGGYADYITAMELQDISPADGIDRDGIKLAPGSYAVYLIDHSAEFTARYAEVTPVYITIDPYDASAGLVDLGTLNFVATPPTPGGTVTRVPSDILDHFRPAPAAVPYGYLSTRIEAVPDPAYGPFAYQFTVHYCGHHTGADATEMTGGRLEVRLPQNVTVVSPGQMTDNGTTLTMDLPALKLGKVYSTTFTADIKNATGDVTFALYSAPNYGGIFNSGNIALALNSQVTLNRPRITLNGPRTVNKATKFRVFGNAAGADGTGIFLRNMNPGVNKDIATGAQKGRYYYFNAGGLDVGTYKLATHTMRFGLDEFSDSIDLNVVAGGATKVDDAYIMRGNKKIGINANFGMIYYTSFIGTDKRVPAFDIYFKLNQAPAAGDTVTLDIGGLSFSTEAPNSSHPNYYKASVNDLYASGEQSVLLQVGSDFTTQLACLLLMF